MSKSKGGRYELEFARRVQDRGLVARKVPLSGAMDGYPGDVVVADEVLVECKYRRNGTGFKTLYQWVASAPREAVAVQCDGFSLLVHTLDEWCARITRLMDGKPGEVLAWPKTSKSRFACLRDWIQGCAFLAVRMPREEWLVVEIIES